MKNFLHAVLGLFESIGRARAATHYSRMGDYESAKRVMQE